MALKDLVAQKSAITEDAIEGIVENFVRYDADEREIAFTPQFSELSNKSKVLVYLVAILGWPFVVDEPVTVDTKPADLSEKIGVPGGSLRPILKDLKDRHLVASKGDGYSVRPANLSAIQREIETGGGALATARKRKPAKRSIARDLPPDGEVDGVNEGYSAPSNKTQKKKKSASGDDISATFKGWISQGYFDEPKVISQVQARFHEEAIIIPRTSIPKYLLRAVRDKSLSRLKKDFNGKQLWTYQTKARAQT